MSKIRIIWIQKHKISDPVHKTMIVIIKGHGESWGLSQMVRPVEDVDVIQARIAQLVEYRLGIGEVPGSRIFQ